eukprot:jgi/Bigna1/91490/estExt_fgenesh1_pg.C_1020061
MCLSYLEGYFKAAGPFYTSEPGHVPPSSSLPPWHGRRFGCSKLHPCVPPSRLLPLPIMRSSFVAVALLHALYGGSAAGLPCTTTAGVLCQPMSRGLGPDPKSRRVIQPRSHRTKRKGRFAQKTPLRPWVMGSRNARKSAGTETPADQKRTLSSSTLLRMGWQKRGKTPFTDLVAGAAASLALTLQLGVGFGHPPSALSDYDMMSDPNQLFETQKYLGTWYEVASMKKGFAGAGQEDCHCTQGMYGVDQKRNRILVNTFCAHGSPDGKISGIQGPRSIIVNSSGFAF